MDFNNPKAVEIYTAKTELFPIEETLFKKHLNKPQRILDLGCGTGRTTVPLHKMGHEVTGIDIAEQMITQAQKLHPEIEFKVGDATNLDYPDKSFDAILFSFNGLDCIYPLANRLKALNEIHRVLKTDGLFIYSSHDRNEVKLNWRTITRIRNYKQSYKKEKTIYGDLILYYGTIKDNLEQLKQTGFTSIEYYSTHGKTWRYYKCQKS